MSKSKEEIEKMQKKEEKKNEEIQKLNGGNINLFKKLVTQKITMESEDEDDEKKDKINCGKINQNKLISNNENSEIENKKENNEENKEKKTESLFSHLTSYTQSIFDIKTNNNNPSTLQLLYMEIHIYLIQTIKIMKKKKKIKKVYLIIYSKKVIHLNLQEIYFQIQENLN